MTATNGHRVRGRWEQVAGIDGPTDGAPVVWGKTAGVWGWLNVDLERVLGGVEKKLGKLKAWFGDLQGQVTNLENEIAGLGPGTVGPMGPAGPAGPEGPAGAGLTTRGQWDAGTQYEAGDLVVYGGYAYIALEPSLGVQPDTNPTDWVLLQTVAGPQGPAGPQGIQGPAGATGPQGATGPAGDPGGTATTVYSGSSSPPTLQWWPSATLLLPYATFPVVTMWGKLTSSQTWFDITDGQTIMDDLDGTSGIGYGQQAPFLAVDPPNNLTSYSDIQLVVVQATG